VGFILFSPLLQKTQAATEAHYLLMKFAFDSGYRRYEWKCDAANIASRSAATRLGFSFEGVFRQALVYKQRNRDTAVRRAEVRLPPFVSLSPECADRVCFVCFCLLVFGAEKSGSRVWIRSGRRCVLRLKRGWTRVTLTSTTFSARGSLT
jgi:Acetyltransferase (GNAT) domain